ncbi:hypothetical protein C8R46DRAFT_1033137 [Mycena filopes]|nr:hypothetical protein C8R46DRAFT_1033137 [Mycena filopes]
MPPSPGPTHGVLHPERSLPSTDLSFTQVWPDRVDRTVAHTHRTAPRVLPVPGLSQRHPPVEGLCANLPVCYVSAPPRPSSSDRHLDQHAARLAATQPYPPGLLGGGSFRPLDAARERDRLPVPFVVIRRRARSRQELGVRDKRRVPLNVDNVLLNDTPPPTVLTTRPHQTCGICLHLKSHPVSYLCGHSHCYRCIRVWLEKRFTCPTCRAVMYEKPHRNFIEEEGIAFDHPNVIDASAVNYNFDGLVFPQKPLLSDW